MYYYSLYKDIQAINGKNETRGAMLHPYRLNFVSKLIKYVPKKRLHPMKHNKSFFSFIL